tara:strand:- start:1026 stop:1286 length:261 start_codon:yes stop_codon:yes gene_type:complete
VTDEEREEIRKSALGIGVECTLSALGGNTNKYLAYLGALAGIERMLEILGELKLRKEVDDLGSELGQLAGEEAKLEPEMVKGFELN